MYSCIVPVACVSAFACLIPPIPDENDPICRLQSEYRREADMLRADRSVDRRPIYEDWFERLQRAVQQFPDSPCAGWATRESRALLNGLGRYRESLDMLEEGLAKAESDGSRGYYLQQMGEVSYWIAFAEKDAELARKSMDSFARLRELEKTPNAGWATGFEHEGSLQSVVFQNHGRAAEAFAEAHRVYTGLSEVQRKGMSDSAGPPPERWLQQAAVEYARVDRAQDAIVALQELETVQGRRQSLGQHLLLVLGDDSQEPKPGALYDFVASWLDEHPDEPRRPEVALRVAEGYDRLGRTEKAAVRFEELLQDAENPAFRERWRAVVEIAAAKLGNLYFRTTQQDKMDLLVERRRDWKLP